MPLYFLFAFTTLTSLKSHSSTRRMQSTRFLMAAFLLTQPTSSANITIDSRTSRSIAWAFAHLSTLEKLRSYDWLSLNPLEINRSQRRSKNMFRSGLRWVMAYMGDSFSELYPLLNPFIPKSTRNYQLNREIRLPNQFLCLVDVRTTFGRLKSKTGSKQAISELSQAFVSMRGLLKCKAIDMKMTFYSHAMQIKLIFALNLV